MAKSSDEKSSGDDLKIGKTEDLTTTEKATSIAREQILSRIWRGHELPDQNSSESWYSTLIDAFVIIALLPSTDVLFTFPLEALNNGGYFFFIIYFIFSSFISFPLLYLELYVAQYTQCGILKAMRIHGEAYTGFGVAIIILMMLNQHVFLHNGYFLLKNILNAVNDATRMVDCRSSYVNNIQQCVSIYNDKQCQESGKGLFFVNGICTNTTAHHEVFIETAAVSYTTKLIEESSKQFEIELVLVQYVFMFICIIIGAHYLRYLLTFFFLPFCILYVVLISAIRFDKFNQLHLIMIRFSNPAALFKIKTYLVALRRAISSFGLCIFGLFSAASFQNQGGRTYAVTMIVFVWVMFTSVMSIISKLSIMYGIQEDSSLSSFRTSLRGIRYAFATVPESIFRQGVNHQLVLLGYYIFTYVMNFSSSLGMIFGVHAFIRDHFSRFSPIVGKLAGFAYCYISFTYYLTFTSKNANYENALESSVVSFSQYFLLSIMIVIFVYAYGVEEFEIDVNTTLGEWSGWLCFLDISKFFTTYHYSLFVLIMLQTIECNRLLEWLQFRSFYDEGQFSTPTGTQGFLLSIFYLLPFLLPLIYFFWVSNINRMEFSKLFDVSPDHPSYRRRNEDNADGTMWMDHAAAAL